MINLGGKMIKLTNPAVTSPIRAVSNRERKLNTYASCIPGIIATEVNTATVVPTCKLFSAYQNGKCST